jgi:hypothetical protein
MSGRVSPEVRGAVLDLLAAVKYAKDDEDAARFEACWAKDACLDITSSGNPIPPVKGREAIMAFYHNVWKSGGHGKEGSRETHVAEHPDMLLQSDGRIMARHAVSFFFAEAGEPRLRGFGTFEDKIILEDGAWRIAHRRSALVRRK